VSGVAIYLEGGGDSTDGKARLRQGMNAFLGPLRDKGGFRKKRWSVIPCGSREATVEAFVDGLTTDPDTFNVLLVDSDDAVTAAPVEHVQLRDRADADAVHLMVRTMETWIVADPQGLARVYGKGFNASGLPRATDLETVEKARVADALKTATKDTARGPYHKTHHIRDVLGALDPAEVRARCKHCERFFVVLESR